LALQFIHVSILAPFFGLTFICLPHLKKVGFRVLVPIATSMWGFFKNKFP
jgi:hypothetical protein